MSQPFHKESVERATTMFMKGAASVLRSLPDAPTQLEKMASHGVGLRKQATAVVINLAASKQMLLDAAKAL